ncbi:hypothetical protein [Vagococcus sp. WN89Y]|uniref:hypothetical protein n=1 Tax=Vagococcus sp. WN89Y TaxID=3457258 RepID=UPI003FCDDC29
MRTISNDELPQDWHAQTLIKSSERSRYRQMATALERTLTRCSEIHAEYESQTVAIREYSEKEGFSAGFALFFSQVITLLDEYEKRQNARFNALRDNLNSALESSLHDPVIVERIIHHLQEKCGHQKALRIIIPKEVPLPVGADASNYLFSDDNHITIQTDTDSIRFPGGALCRQWLTQAENEITPMNENINTLIPELLHKLGNQLLDLSDNKTVASYLHSEEE